MKGKICLVTGANAGIGLATARGLAAQGATVILACRSLEKGKAAQADLIAATGNPAVHLMVLDMSRLADVRRFAAECLAQFPKIDVLINNAGAFFSEFEKTEDGIERQLAVNHVAPFLLTLLLLPALKAAAPARIVMVSSGAHFNGKIHWDDLNGEQNYSAFAAYAQSKLGNVLFANEFGRRYPGIGVTANSLHPGVVRTEIGQKNKKWLYRIGWAFMKPFMVSSTKGAATSLHVACSPKLEGVTGKFFDKCREKQPSAEALNLDNAARLWDITAKLCGL